MNESIPQITGLEEIYYPENLNLQQKRWNDLEETFSSIYGHTAQYMSRSSGRVNLLGEHVDYSLYPVLPMAVEQDILIAFSILPMQTSSEKSDKSQCHVHVSNTKDKQYPDGSFSFHVSESISIDASSHDWKNYIRAGYNGALSIFQSSSPSSEPISIADKTISILVSGIIPPAGGLSSSAALTCAATLTFAIALGMALSSITKTSLVEAAIIAERGVGVNSGGMDQSASVFGEKGKLVSVDFIPNLKVTLLDIPGLNTNNPQENKQTDVAFVIAQSLVMADKKVTGPECYNLRVVECTLAALVLSKITGLKSIFDPRRKKDSSPLGMSLRTFQETYFDLRPGILDLNPPSEGLDKNAESESRSLYEKQLVHLLNLVDNYLIQSDGYTTSQIADILSISVEDIQTEYMTIFPVKANRFKLRQRAMHVFSEALRVHHFTTLLLSASKDTDLKDLYVSLGALMDETQESLRLQFDCSCDEIDELCRIAKEGGAYGSRLTGAGWGGCTVHLIPMGKVEHVKMKWEYEYYRKRWKGITKQEVEEAILVTKPGKGSCLYTVKE